MRKRYINIENKEEIEKLIRLKRSSKSRQERIRSGAIILSNEGVQIKDIAKKYNTTWRTIFSWFNGWEENGFKSLSRKQGGGRKAILNTAIHKEVVLKHIEENPHKPKKAYALATKELDVEISYKTFKYFLKKL